VIAVVILLAAASFAKLEADVASGQFKKIGSVLVAQHGKVVYEKYFEGDADALRDTRSATKTITGALIGLAVHDKKLALNTKVWPQLGRPDKAGITVRDLLTMSSALDCNDWVDGSPGNEEKMYPTQDWAAFVLDLPTREARTFSYCTGGVFLLGQALQRATGMAADVYARQKLFAPLGIAHVQWAFSPRGQPMTGGGLRLTTRDLWKFAQLYLDGGRDVVEAAWVHDSVEPHARIDEQTEYGYLWWLKSFGGKPAWFMTGNGGNKVVVFPSLDAVVVITSTNYNTRGMHQQTEKLLVDDVLPAISGN
jgi:CubicO group peptidase (beta-lactamase class C family)